MKTDNITPIYPKKLWKISQQKVFIFFSMTILLVYICLWNYFPILYSLVGSFHKWKPNNNVFAYNGIANYKWLFSEASFWESLWHTIVIAISVSVLTAAIGLIIATMIYSLPKAKGFFRTSYFLPYITSTVAVAIVWKYGIYNTDNGVLNYILELLHIPPQLFLLSETEVVPSIIAQMIWKDVGYAVIIYYAGISGIPNTFFEAARIDGATPIQVFRNVVIPLIKPTTILLLINGLIIYMQVFNQVVLMTSTAGGAASMGGPGTSSNVTMLMIYQQGFLQWNFGRAAAIGYVLAFIILIFTFIQLKFNETDWGY